MAHIVDGPEDSGTCKCSHGTTFQGAPGKPVPWKDQEGYEYRPGTSSSFPLPNVNTSPYRASTCEKCGYCRHCGRSNTQE